MELGTSLFASGWGDDRAYALVHDNVVGGVQVQVHVDVKVND
jgi:hypothetical protein